MLFFLYYGLKALNVIQSKLGMIFFFSSTRIKVNYISLLTGMPAMKEGKMFWVLGVLSFYCEEIP